jgi:hypothetical protein
MNSNEFLVDSNYKPVKIKSITPVAIEKTYDFQVADDHSFLLENNIISSNCMEFVPSISLRVTKGKIKPTDLAELEYLYDGGIPKHLGALGIVSRIELYKSRFTRPFRKVQLMIPYDFGLPEYAGLFDYLKDNGIIIENGRKGYYNCTEVQFEKDFTRKDFIKGGWADLIMEHLLAEETKGRIYDFIMKSSDDDAREKEQGLDSIDDSYIEDDDMDESEFNVE